MSESTIGLEQLSGPIENFGELIKEILRPQSPPSKETNIESEQLTFDCKSLPGWSNLNPAKYIPTQFLPSEILELSSEERAKRETLSSDCDRKTYEAFKNAIYAIEPLQVEADFGDERSFGFILQLTFHLIERVTHYENTMPEMVGKFASHQTVWPATLSTHPTNVEDNLKRLTDLGLGKKALIGVEASNRWTWRSSQKRNNRAGQVAVCLLKKTDEIRRIIFISKYMAQRQQASISDLPTWMTQCACLPRPQKSNSQVWWEEVFEPMLLESTNGQPEDVPFLHRLGKCGEEKTVGKKGRYTSARQRRMNIRSVIYHEIRRSIAFILNDLDK